MKEDCSGDKDLSTGGSGLKEGSGSPRRILVHMCCGPCSIVPLKALVQGNSEVWGFFHNPNIHPYSEFKKRLAAVKTLARLLRVNVLYDEEYRPSVFLKGVKESAGYPGRGIPAREVRCSYCYSSRLIETAKAAKAGGFDAFSSSLLYSKYQMHEEIKTAGIELSGIYGILFYYEDFRTGWQDGIKESKEMGLYRQKYCGCIYSKIERYSNKKNAPSKAL